MGSAVGTPANSSRPQHLKVEVCQTVKEGRKPKEISLESFTVEGDGMAIMLEKHGEDNRHSEHNHELPAARYERATGATLRKQYLAERNTSQILVVRKDEGFCVVPHMESFSRISGICKILGDSHSKRREKHEMKVGDFIRFGSVGLVVSEMCTTEGEPQVIETSHLKYLKSRVFQQMSAESERSESYGEATTHIAGHDETHPRSSSASSADANPRSEGADGQADGQAEGVEVDPLDGLARSRSDSSRWRFGRKDTMIMGGDSSEALMDQLASADRADSVRVATKKRRKRRQKKERERSRGPVRRSEDEEGEGKMSEGDTPVETSAVEAKQNSPTFQAAAMCGGVHLGQGVLAHLDHSAATPSEVATEHPHSPPHSPSPSHSTPHSTVHACANSAGELSYDLGSESDSEDDGSYESDGGSATEDENEDGTTNRNRVPGEGNAAAEASPLGVRMAQEGFGDGDGESKLCYVCCDEAVEGENPLVSACNCKGGTKWVHLECLQTLLNNGAKDGNKPCVVTSHLAAICKVCRSEYRKKCKLEDGTVVPITHPRPKPPYICFTGVTHNVTSNQDGNYFNLTFQISFDSIMSTFGDRAHQPLFIGRSHEMDIKLAYQTVSGRHAAVYYENGVFSVKDQRSSNGTLLYLREPLDIAPCSTTRLRVGRKTIKICNLPATRWQKPSTSGGTFANSKLDRGSPKRAKSYLFSGSDGGGSSLLPDVGATGGGATTSGSSTTSTGGEESPIAVHSAAYHKILRELMTIQREELEEEDSPFIPRMSEYMGP